MQIEFLGAAGEVGRSAILVETDQTFLLDCGLKIHTDEAGQAYPLPPPLPVDVAVISHSHLDHVGFLPSLFDHHHPRIIATPPTKALAELLLLDSAKILIEEYGTLPYQRSSHKKAMGAFALQAYHQKTRIGETDVTLADAGHIPGSSTVLLETQGKRIGYSGDFKLSDTRMHNAAEPMSDLDVLVTESTYFYRDHPNRSDLEVQLVQRAREVVENGGNLLLPAFAVGRTQELISVLKSNAPELKVWVDGMGIEASRIVSGFSSYINDAKKFRAQLDDCQFVTDPRQRKNVLAEPSVIISTAGMLQGGPALGYLLSLSEKSEVIFTGYSVEGTNGWNLLQHGFVEKEGTRIQPSVPVRYLDFSAHAGRSELFKFVEQANPDKVYCVHGDKCPEFAEELKLEGFDAYAPKLGEKVQV